MNRRGGSSGLRGGRVPGRVRILGSGFRLMLTEIRRRHIRLPGLGWRLGLTRRELAAMWGLGSKKLGRALREGELPELLRLAITDQLRIPTRYS